nr:MAG TPA: hypothetical protein [Caudoviricetes sp.]
MSKVDVCSLRTRYQLKTAKKAGIANQTEAYRLKKL